MKPLFAILCIALTLFTQAQTSKDTPKLKEALKRFPAADANGDGVDPDRIAASGGSAGGYLAAATLLMSPFQHEPCASRLFAETGRS